jgi:hypothetical protein
MDPNAVFSENAKTIPPLTEAVEKRSGLIGRTGIAFAV